MRSQTEVDTQFKTNEIDWQTSDTIIQTSFRTNDFENEIDVNKIQLARRRATILHVKLQFTVLHCKLYRFSVLKPTDTKKQAANQREISAEEADRFLPVTDSDLKESVTHTVGEHTFQRAGCSMRLSNREKYRFLGSFC